MKTWAIFAFLLQFLLKKNDFKWIKEETRKVFFHFPELGVSSHPFQKLWGDLGGWCKGRIPRYYYSLACLFYRLLQFPMMARPANGIAEFRKQNILDYQAYAILRKTLLNFKAALILLQVLIEHFTKTIDIWMISSGATRISVPGGHLRGSAS